MGQAKRRGEFQKRKEMAIQKKADDKLKAEQAYAEAKARQEEYWNSLSEEDKEKVREQNKKRQEARRLLSMAMNFARHNRIYKGDGYGV